MNDWPVNRFGCCRKESVSASAAKVSFLRALSFSVLPDKNRNNILSVTRSVLKKYKSGKAKFKNHYKFEVFCTYLVRCLLTKENSINISCRLQATNDIENLVTVSPGASVIPAEL